MYNYNGCKKPKKDIRDYKLSVDYLMYMWQNLL